MLDHHEFKRLVLLRVWAEEAYVISAQMGWPQGKRIPMRSQFGVPLNRSTPAKKSASIPEDVSGTGLLAVIKNPSLIAIAEENDLLCNGIVCHAMPSG